MEIISARDFRSNQTRILKKAMQGQSVLISSRVGVFKILPVTEDDTLSRRITDGLKEAKLIEQNRLKGHTVEELLNEL